MKKQSTMGGFAVLSSAVLIVKILSLIYIPFVIAILGDEGYGIYMGAYQVFALIFAVTNSGLPSAISKIVSELKAVENYRDAIKAFKMARFMLIAAGFMMSIILFFGSRFLTNILSSPKSYLAVLALSPTIIFSTVTSSYRGYFQGSENMIPTAVSQVLEQIVNIIFTLLLSYLLLRYGLEAACAGGSFATTIAAVFAAGFLVYTYKRNQESKIIKFHNPKVVRYTNKELFMKIFNYSLPLTLYQALFYLGNIIDYGNTKTRLLVAGFSDKNSNILYGYLSKTNQLIGVPNAIIASLSVALLPSISASVARNEHKLVKEKINSAFKICFMISIPAAVGLSIMSYPVFNLLKLRGGAYIMVWASYILILMSCVQIFSAILQGLGKLYIVAFFLVIGIIGKITTNYILIGMPKINIMGAIFGNVAYYVVPLILDNIILIRILKIKTNIFIHAVKPAISSVVMGIVLYSVYSTLNYLIGFITHGYISILIPSLISIPMGTYIYFYMMAYIRGISKEDLDILPSKIRKLIPNSIYKLVNKRSQE